MFVTVVNTAAAALVVENTETVMSAENYFVVKTAAEETVTDSFVMSQNNAAEMKTG